MKKTLTKILAKVRGAKSDKRAAPESSSYHAIGPSITGRTIFADRPLRFTRFTVPDPDLPSISDLTGFGSVFKIRVAHRMRKARDAKVLVERRYAGRGYQIPVIKQDSNLMTFLAYDEGNIVGTVSVRLDSRRKRISANELYPDEIARLRAEGWGICEFTRLAVDTSVASKPVLATLFHTAYLYASIVRGFTYAVIEVNPRHAAFYAKALRFQPIGPERTNRRVNAPAVLLGVPFATIAQGLKDLAGKPATAESRGSLFRFGFPSNDQHGVLHRLQDLVQLPTKK